MLERSMPNAISRMDFLFSAGSDNTLRNKRRYPTLIRLLPTKLEDYVEAFFVLLQHYKWNTVTCICMSNSSENYFFGSACRQFPAILRRQGGKYSVMDFETNLSDEYARIAALTKAKFQSRGIRFWYLLWCIDLSRCTWKKVYTGLFCSNCDTSPYGSCSAYPCKLHSVESNPFINSPKVLTSTLF